MSHIYSLVSVRAFFHWGGNLHSETYSTLSQNELFTLKRSRKICILIFDSVFLSMPLHAQSSLFGAVLGALTPLCVFCEFVSFTCCVYSPPATSKPSPPRRDGPKYQWLLIAHQNCAPPPHHTDLPLNCLHLCMSPLNTPALSLVLQ